VGGRLADEECGELAAPGDVSPVGADVDLVVAVCWAQLRPLGSWPAAGGYPDGLGVAVLDAVWAMGPGTRSLAA
jgi:hypothetical protein